MLTDEDILKKMKGGSLQVEIKIDDVPNEVILLAKEKDALVLKRVFLRLIYWDSSIQDIRETEEEVGIDEFWNLLLAIYAQDGPIDSLETIRLMYIHGFIMNDQIIYKGMLYSKTDLSCSPSLTASTAGRLLN
ncbi:hypothetical protein HN958_02985 [Candidatus Falkowbacteria bacterium]|nr:hypothetical protein [Candidatus Falkowbacteria bacterium]MBT7007444.1 hypothetical protein [Candidatus Falkowbacteria bacterium]